VPQAIHYDDVVLMEDDGLTHLAPETDTTDSTLCGRELQGGTDGEADCPECIKMREALAVIDGNGA
jgi:hypothetical protein